jgi:DNA-binding IscR family transcriptional regulator
VTPAAAKASILDVVSVLSRGEPEMTSREAPRWIRRLEGRADEAYRSVLASITIEEIAGAVRAERNALSWVI